MTQYRLNVTPSDAGRLILDVVNGDIIHFVSDDPRTEVEFRNPAPFTDPTSRFDVKATRKVSAASGTQHPYDMLADGVASRQGEIDVGQDGARPLEPAPLRDQ